MLTSAHPTALVAGLIFGLSLIVAIGAQNTSVLRQGLVRQHVLTVVAICALSDVVLIAAGVAGASAVLTGRPWLLPEVRIVGAAFLFGMAFVAARRARRSAPVDRGNEPISTSYVGLVAACLAFTWLNPAVYLDTVVLLGSVANARAGQRWWFAAGAAAGSVVWFAALGYGARLLTPLFRRPGAWRVLDVSVAAVMTATGLRMLLGA